MTIKTCKVKQYNSPPKILITVDGEPFMLARSQARANKIIAYINGANVEFNGDRRIIKMVETLRSQNTELE